MDKKRGLLNIGTSIVSRIILLLAALYIRRLLILYIGNEVNGLNSLYGSIIGLLSVAELGVGGAIIYSMYSPIVKGDDNKVAALYCLYRKLYRIIGAVIFGAGLAVMPFFPRMISDYSSLDVDVYITFLLTLISVVISYLYSAKSALIEAYKDNYISTAIVTISRMIRSALQIAAIMIWKSFEIFLICQIIETIIVWIATEKVVKRLHPDILILSKSEKPVLDPESKKDITRNIKAMFMHKIGSIFVASVDSMIISIFIGVVILGKYSNYTAILGAMTGIIVLFFTPLTSVIGHLCAAKEPGEIRQYFNFFYSMNFVLGLIFFMGYYAVIDNIVEVLFGSELTMSRAVPFVITVNGFIGYMRYALIMFRDASGIFYYDRWKPIGESIANIILSVIFVNIFPTEYSVVGVIVATIITCLLICNIVEPHILFKYVFKEPAIKFYLLNYSRTVVFTLCLLLVDRLSISCENSIIELLVNGMISVGISAALLGLLVATDRSFRQDVKTLILQVRQWCGKLAGKINRR